MTNVYGTVLVFTARGVGVCVALCLVILTAPVNAAPVSQDAHVNAVEHVRQTIRNSVARVTGGTVAERTGAAPVSVEEDTNWPQFRSGELGLKLPASFVGGNLDDDLPVIIEALRMQGPDYAAMADMIEQNPSVFRLFAFDPDSIESGVLTNVNITEERVLSFITTDLYLDSVETQLPDGFDFGDREEIAHPGFVDARRVVTRVAIPGAPAMRQAMYFFKSEDNMVWTLTFTAADSIFDEQLSTFDRSAGSFSTSLE